MNPKLAHKADVVSENGAIVKNRYGCISCCNPNCQGIRQGLDKVTLYAFTEESLMQLLRNAERRGSKPIRRLQRALTKYQKKSAGE